MLRARWLALGAALLVSATASVAMEATRPRRPGVPLNEYGLPVRDEAGNPRTYSRDELAGRARLEPATRPAATAGPAADARAVAWYAAFGHGVGKSNIVVAGQGGASQVYLGGSTSVFGADDYWHALAYEPGGWSRQTYVSPYFGPSGTLARIEAADVDPSAGPEILVALDNGRIEIYSAATKAWLRGIDTGAGDIDGLAVADLDGDTANEIIVCTATSLHVFAADGTLIRSVGNAGGRDVVAAQMDADAALEIALTDGSVVDGVTGVVEWKRAGGFGRHLEAADVDGDGIAELIAAEDWYIVWAYDVDRRLPKWSISTPQDVGAILVTDVDADGTHELLVGDGQWGSIRAYDAATQQLEWTIANPEHGVTAIAAADVDGDGTSEVLWGAGATSTGKDHLYVADWAAGQIEWQNVHLDGPFAGPERADLDGDGLPEIVAASWESDAGYGSGRILVFDGQTFALRGISPPIVGNRAWTGLHDLRLRDVDGDGRAEILVAADYLYDGVVEIYGFDAASVFTLKWTNATRPAGAPFYGVEASDLDGDGQVEIVASAGREHTGAQGVFVYVYDYASGAEEWHSLQMGGYWDDITGLQVGDTNGDGMPEIVAMVERGDTYVFDGPTKQLQAILPGQGTALRLHVGPTTRILVGDLGGALTAYEHQAGSYGQVFRRDYAAGPVDGFETGPDRALWLGTGGRLSAMTLAGDPLWQSASYGTVFGARTLVVPLSRAFLSAGSYAVVAFKAW